MQYAQDMRSGNCHTSGQSIQFDWDGRLIDGQHRCEAVIESGVTVRVLVVRGSDPRSRQVIDTGAKGTGGDALRFAGFTQDPTVHAAVARIANARDNGYPRTAIASNMPSLSNSDVIAWAELNPDVSGAISLARALAKASTSSLLCGRIVSTNSRKWERVRQLSLLCRSQICAWMERAPQGECFLRFSIARPLDNDGSPESRNRSTSSSVHGTHGQEG